MLRLEREHGNRDPAASWYVDGLVVEEGHEPLLGTKDEDGHVFYARRGFELNEVGPHLPVRVRIYRGADKETVLKMLDKMRAEVERAWGVNSAEWDAEVAAQMFEIMQHPPVEHDRSDAIFGVCPACKGQDGYLNIGRDHWFKCDEHKTKWHVGSNLFSSWRHEDEAAWEENARELSEYEEVEPDLGSSR
jgi:hypothetical protein